MGCREHNRKRGNGFKSYLKDACWLLKRDHIFLFEEKVRGPRCSFITCLQKGLHFIKLLRIILAIFPRYNSEAWLLVLLFLFLKKKKKRRKRRKSSEGLNYFLSTNKCCCFYRVLLIYYKVLCMKRQLKKITGHESERE